MPGSPATKASGDRSDEAACLVTLKMMAHVPAGGDNTSRGRDSNGTLSGPMTPFGDEGGTALTATPEVTHTERRTYSIRAMDCTEEINALKETVGNLPGIPWPRIQPHRWNDGCAL